ncbi:hypothetical protein FEM48_Zijuj08G0125300 [Ziziphus jujuba var. spinosa]|uniref:Cytochrome P450 81E8-like n=1 Tax=Ziziphus jujuba var. spinosa TaxID=714518 RepID=A0A978UZ45_ZIZJJ|nr:hypothetical protein FEM48_Zijuj08G0125300 [Ziziphus jujuba var. spinosa]
MEDALFYTCLSLIIFFFAFKLFYLQYRSPYKNLPPGPFSLPIIGHLHLLRPPVHRTLRRLSQNYGPIFTLWLGSRRVVVVSSAPAVEECFNKNDIVLANRPQLLLGKHVHYNYTTVAATPYGDHWRNLRRIGSLEVFSSSRLNMFLGIRKDEVKRFLRKLSHNSRQNFSKVEMKSSLTELTFNIVIRMVAGERYYGDDVTADKEEAQNFREVIEELMLYGGTTNQGDFLPTLKWIGINGFERRIKKLAKKTDRLLQRLIEEHRRNQGSRNTMIDHLLSLQQSQPECYTDQIIKGFILIVSAVLGSIGLSNVGNGSEDFDFRAYGSQRSERTVGATGMFDTTQLQPEHAGMRVPSDRLHGAFGHSAAFSLGSLPSDLKIFDLVIPNSLTSLSQYLRSIRSEFDAMDLRSTELYAVSPKTTAQFSLSGSDLAALLWYRLPRPSKNASKKDIVLPNRPRLLLRRHVHYNYTTVAATPYGDHRRNLRCIGSLEVFSSSRLNMFFGIRKDEMKRLLCKLSHNSRQKFSKVEMKSSLTELTFNIGIRMVAGERYYGDDFTADKEEAQNFREVNGVWWDNKPRRFLAYFEMDRN